MTRDIADIRRDYEGGNLDEAQVPTDPFTMFDEWFALALDTDPQDANAMTLSTVDSQGLPHARVVLLKGFDSDGMVFYTNYHSHKGSELANVPHAALTFWWPKLARQVRIEGRTEQVCEQESDEYFASRPRAASSGPGSPLRAWSFPIGIGSSSASGVSRRPTKVRISLGRCTGAATASFPT